jgi:hypothetical protein
VSRLISDALIQRCVGATPPVGSVEILPGVFYLPHASYELPPPVFIRASGDVLCRDCGREYWRHPYSADQGFAGPYLHVLCDLSLVKL